MDNQTKFMITCMLFAAICSSVSSAEWKATVVKSIDALVTCCVVVPCSFSHTGGNLPTSRLRGIWHEKDDKKSNIYHEDPTLMKESFEGRTKLVGLLGQNNCTLEITDVKDHDNGPFCFRVELVQTENNEPTKDMFSFVEDCVKLNMLTEPPKPTVIKPKTATLGEPYTVTCSVIHTCPTHVPKLTWNHDSAKVTVHHKDIKQGNWVTQSILTFIPEEKDDNREITCTAEFNGGLKSPETFTIHVKRIENYNHIIIPAVVGIGTALLFGIFCILMAKKIQEPYCRASKSRRNGKTLKVNFQKRPGSCSSQQLLQRGCPGEEVHGPLLGGGSSVLAAKRIAHLKSQQLPHNSSEPPTNL
ncbi:myelin-associated glycoprotein [Oreochromis niloticus]|uniref:myelin-associated glycoprotein n=1 Tax=Oreochromis niloticus TaxID=8128 RepID=UPI000DF250FE|nr:myelin-associated glycoprotein [Oreochromis niloticus]